MLSFLETLKYDGVIACPGSMPKPLHKGLLTTPEGRCCPRRARRPTQRRAAGSPLAAASSLCLSLVCLVCSLSTKGRRSWVLAHPECNHLPVPAGLLNAWPALPFHRCTLLNPHPRPDCAASISKAGAAWLERARSSDASGGACPGRGFRWDATWLAAGSKQGGSCPCPVAGAAPGSTLDWALFCCTLHASSPSSFCSAVELRRATERPQPPRRE